MGDILFEINIPLNPGRYFSSFYVHAVALFLIYYIWRPFKRVVANKVTSTRTKKSHVFPVVPLSPISDVSISDDETVVTANTSICIRRKSVSEVEDDEHLEYEFPNSFPSERRRFLAANNGDYDKTKVALGRYLEWVNKYEAFGKDLVINKKTNNNDPDLDTWNLASAIAIRASGESCSEQLPRVIRVHRRNGRNVCDLDGNLILHIIPAQMDDNLVKLSTYALASALYIDMKCNRSNFDRVTVCMDVRAGLGWPNIHAFKLVGFMKDTTQLLLTLFPERLHKCVLYPVPSLFLWVWQLISKCMDDRTRSKICVLSGVNSIPSPPPFTQMYPHLGYDVSHLLEEERVAAFKL